MARVPRVGMHRLIYRRVLQCPSCGYRHASRRLPFEATTNFVLAPYTCCIQCGNLRVRRLPERDQIDAMSHHPISVLLGLLFAPIYHCNSCRLQYRDFRKTSPAARVLHGAAPNDYTDHPSQTPQA